MASGTRSSPAATKAAREKFAADRARLNKELAEARAGKGRRPFLDKVAHGTPDSMRKLVPAGLRHRLRARIDRKAGGQ